LSEKPADPVERDLGSKRKFSSSHGSARKNVASTPMFLNVQSGSDESDEEKPF
jgi:hypothetical protein